MQQMMAHGRTQLEVGFVFTGFYAAHLLEFNHAYTKIVEQNNNSFNFKCLINFNAKMFGNVSIFPSIYLSLSQFRFGQNAISGFSDEETDGKNTNHPSTNQPHTLIPISHAQIIFNQNWNLPLLIYCNNNFGYSLFLLVIYDRHSEFYVIGKKKGKTKKKKKPPSRPPSPVYIEVQVSE